jgi:hypothetical protein
MGPEHWLYHKGLALLELGICAVYSGNTLSRGGRVGGRWLRKDREPLPTLLTPVETLYIIHMQVIAPDILDGRNEVIGSLERIKHSI